MRSSFRELFRKKIINGWSLFSLISISISIAMIVGMLRSELSTAEGVASMIQLSVRFAVPWLYVAFSASSVHVLFSSDFSAWVLRNRKYFGLSFAVGMAWQALFILWMLGVHTDDYVNEVYVLRDLIEGLVGYLFLIPMTLTTFRFGRRLVSRKQWRILHKAGIYYLWAYAFSVYWWELFFYSNPAPVNYLYYWAGFLAWGLRAAAWSKSRRRSAGKGSEVIRLPRLADFLGGVVIGMGIAAACLGSQWQGAAQELLYGYTFTTILELYLPYWPFEPFLPLLVIGIGGYLISQSAGAKAQKKV
jgi:hypothetical protein